MALKVTFWFWVKVAGLTGLGLFFLWGPARGAEPMMDSDIFQSSRLGALNLVRDGDFQDAINVESNALRIATEQFGPLHPSLVPIFSDLGTLYRFLAEYKKSEEEYKWGLALLEKTMGPDHPLVAGFLDRLAALYNDLGRYTEAELLEKRSLAIQEADPKGDPRALTQSLELLGRIELSLRNPAQAQTLVQEAIGRLEKSPSPNAGLSINLLDTLAQIYRSEKKFSQAQFCLEKALDSAKKDFPADSAEVADAIEGLADFFHAQGEDGKARPLYESAFQIDRRFVGTVYSYLSLPYLKRLAKVDLSIGQVENSEGLWKKALQTEKEVFGPRHPRVALDLLHLSVVESALKKKSRAQEDLKESLDILKSYFPDDHPLVLLVRKQLE